jgi:DNA mismatch repair protein MutS
MGYVSEESDEDVLFLYKLTNGGCSSSFGINVGKMAGLPCSILKRAQNLSELFENCHQGAEVVPLQRQLHPSQVHEEEQEEQQEEQQ